MPTTLTRSIEIETQFFNTTRLFDLISQDNAGSYITRAINRKRQMLSKVYKTFDPEEELPKRSVVISKGPSQESK